GFLPRTRKKKVVPFFFLPSRSRGFLLFKKKGVLLLTSAVLHLHGRSKSLLATSPMLEAPLPPTMFLPSGAATLGLWPPPRPRPPNRHTTPLPTLIVTSLSVILVVAEGITGEGQNALHYANPELS
ncbi:hypothetical protein V8G54_008462, partial [Vigna mungo]